ncbi:hypothetical protein ABW19_dt0205662 [Dactylella cylindrospora]|nr:hypothetical protein ABW19_dt0205662 [Dactylella cylindrospora]
MAEPVQAPPPAGKRVAAAKDATTPIPSAKYNNVLIEYNELEPWQKDNEFILTGYRKPSYDYSRSLQSIWYIHNETGNIWSHILGTLLFLYSLASFLSTSLPILRTSSPSDLVAMSIYYLAVVNCFILSSTFHVFSNHSAPIHKFGNELDHLGIVCVIWGSAIPCSYFAFYDTQGLTRYAYYLLHTLFATASGVFTLRPKFRQPQYRKARFYMYVLLGVSAFLPVAHGLYAYGFEELDARMGLTNFIGLGMWQFTGAAIYAARIPERWFSRRFDCWGQSHQIMHVLVVFGAICNERGLLRAIEYWNDRKL